MNKLRAHAAKSAAGLRNQDDLLDALHRVNGLAVAIASILDPCTELGANDLFAARMIAQTIEVQTTIFIEVAETEHLIIATEA